MEVQFVDISDTSVCLAMHINTKKMKIEIIIQQRTFQNKDKGSIG